MSNDFDIERFPTSPSAVRMLSRISPIYDRAYVGKWIFQVMGLEVDDMRQRYEELRDQAFPETATWGLKYWEQRYNITPSSADTLEQRRRAVLAVRSVREPVNPAKIEKIVQTMTGCAAKVTEDVAPYTFTVEIFANGDDLNFDAVFKKLKRIKPSHQRMIMFVAATAGLQIAPAREAFTFPYRMAGTYPQTNIVGVLQGAEIDIGIEGAAAGFSYPLAGEHSAGTIPDISTQGVITGDGITAGIATSSTSFDYPLCGDSDS